MARRGYERAKREAHMSKARRLRYVATDEEVEVPNLHAMMLLRSLCSRASRGTNSALMISSRVRQPFIFCALTLL